MGTEASEIPPEPELRAEAIGRRCLVTGGAGYVGRAIIRRLADAGCEVRSMDIAEHEPDRDIETVVADLRDYDAVRQAVEGVDTIFHVAALINIKEFARPAERKLVYDVNVLGTQNILRAADDAGVTALVQTSSFSVVLDRVLVNTDEREPYATRTRDLYTLTKIEAERAVLGADAPGGLRTCALRPGGVWGIDVECVMIRSFLTQYATGKFKTTIGNGKATMDNTHVQNLVDAQLLAAKALRRDAATVGGQAYFINDDEAINPLEWFRPLVEGCGGSFPRLSMPASFMKVVGSLMEIGSYFGAPEPLLTRRGIRNITESSQFNIDKARRDLGYEPRYNHANGMPLLVPKAREYVESFDKNAA